MTNHMESELLTFADGIRGRTLWHNEYRSKYEFDSAGKFQCNSVVDGKPGLFPPCNVPGDRLG